jgi:two-component system sensor histidine kinase BaeS
MPPPREEGQGRRDPMGFASRISIQDADANPLVGPPEFPPGIERDIKVEGKVVGRMRLVPLRQAIGSDASATGFLREQMQSLLLLSGALILLAILAAIWLARHLLRPVEALREVTSRIACGEFDARAPLLSRDELAELALYVNAMAEALEESEQQRRKMLADVSHELRTPLTVIRGEIEALLDGIRKADAGALASLHAEVLRLNKLVDDLHQLTLADAGDLQYQWQEVDLSQLLLPILARYQPRAQQVGLDLSWSLPPSAVNMRKADAGRLTQVLTNLLENSVRYTDSGGQIVVALTQANRMAELTVEDSAPGVSQEAYSAMFDRLYRADAARSRARGGSGLGLAICKALVEAHGGSIVALPSVLGGVKMLIRLPLDKA